MVMTSNAAAGAHAIFVVLPAETRRPLEIAAIAASSNNASRIGFVKYPMGFHGAGNVGQRGQSMERAAVVTLTVNAAGSTPFSVTELGTVQCVPRGCAPWKLQLSATLPL
jgi:hypothetical protein